MNPAPVKFADPSSFDEAGADVEATQLYMGTPKRGQQPPARGAARLRAPLPSTTLPHLHSLATHAASRRAASFFEGATVLPGRAGWQGSRRGWGSTTHSNTPPPPPQQQHNSNAPHNTRNAPPRA